MTHDLTTRPLVPTDAGLLQQATLGNLNWSARRFTKHDVTSRPYFRHYTQVVPERGDFGIIAEREGEAIGVAWAQFMPETDPGFGFLDEATPEISLWVRDDSRGSGVGRTLLRWLQYDAMDRGVDRLSLSVESHNFARRLYASEGFTPVAGRQGDGVMLWMP